MTPDPNGGREGQAGLDPSDQNLPTPDVGSRSVPIARQPMEQIAGAMQLQAELLKQMHERQRMLEDVVKDNRRHELVINSAQALNDSFQGLQRVQERLADQLQDSGGVSRGRFAVIALALLALAGVGAILTWRITDSADAFNANLKSALDPRARDQELEAALAKLEGRVHGVEEADRAAFRDELERLRKVSEAIGGERDTLRRERDSAREELGAAKSSLSGAQTELADVKGKLPALEKENARLTTQSVGDQKTIVQLNDLIVMMKDTKAATMAKTGAADGEAAPKPTTPPPESAVPSEKTLPPAAPPTAVPDAAVAAKPDAEVVAAGPEPLVAFPVAQLDPLNALLKSHRGSDQFELKKAEKIGQKKLWNVAMEVRGPDGTLNKSIEAESLAFGLRGDLLEIEFEGGSVTFHQGTGKSVRSPFYNNRYVIVVLGANGKEWAAANLTFVKVK